MGIIRQTGVDLQTFSEVNLTLHHTRGNQHKWSENQPGTEVGLAAIADASFMQQIGEGLQCADCIMIAPTTLYEGKQVTHLIDWNSGKIHRKMDQLQQQKLMELQDLMTELCMQGQ